MSSSTSCSSLARVRVHDQVLRAAGVGGDERQVDLRRHRLRELDLRLLGRLLEPLERDRGPSRRSMPCSLLELVGEPVDDALVEVVAAEVRVAVRALAPRTRHRQVEDRDVERPAAEVVDGDFSSFFLSKPYASAAAVGSLMMRRTSRPAIFPASFVASTLSCC